MADSALDPIAVENAVYADVPEFGWRHPSLWFAQFNVFFDSRRIRSQSSMYNFIVANLPEQVATEVADLIYTRPSVSPYDTLKAAIIGRTAATDEQNLRKLRV
ncbi:hypothetical protein AHF37_00662 [Paragonimus kellicotti]|nr:hypothetical protein AHF37_00662 [Paragonimus kellicotti]